MAFRRSGVRFPSAPPTPQRNPLKRRQTSGTIGGADSHATHPASALAPRRGLRVRPPNSSRPRHWLVKRQPAVRYRFDFACSRTPSPRASCVHTHRRQDRPVLRGRPDRRRGETPGTAEPVQSNRFLGHSPHRDDQTGPSDTRHRVAITPPDRPERKAGPRCGQEANRRR